MNDQELGTIRDGEHRFSGYTTYYLCNDCQGFYVTRGGGGLGSYRQPARTPERVAREERERAQRHAKEQRLRARIDKMRPCTCGPKTPPPARRATPASPARRAAATQQTTPPGGSLPADLAALAKLWESGALTDQEFAAAKARLLGTTTSETAVNQPSATGRRPTAPPGWYRDPSGGSSQDRYWNGTEWTEFTQQRAEASSAPLTSGSRVAHPTFGDGTVVEVRDREVLVNFDRFGRKWLATDYAKLRPL